MQVAARTGYPVAVKASAGGGGRGIRIAGDQDELRSVLPVAQAEAQSAFGSSDVYIERMIQGAKHIEVQVFGDGRTFVHLGERDCSVQRRRQKLIEETPAHGLPQEVREALCASAVALAAAVKYQGAGTVEFLYEKSTGEFFFIEMNTRVQVEHPVTEMVTGVDVVKEGLRAAAGRMLELRQRHVSWQGHAIECRVNAEDPWTMRPAPGTIRALRLPGGPGIRVDSGVAAGSTVPREYDPLLFKIVAHGVDRTESLARMRSALAETRVEGLTTNLAMHRALLDDPDVVAGALDTGFLEGWLARTATPAIASSARAS